MIFLYMELLYNKVICSPKCSGLRLHWCFLSLSARLDYNVAPPWWDMRVISRAR